MKIRKIPLAGLVVLVGALLWMVGGQVRLAREVKNLNRQLAESKSDEAGGARALPKPSPTARPGRASKAEWAALGEARQIADLRKQLAELRGELADIKTQNAQLGGIRAGFVSTIEPFQSGPTEERTLEPGKPMRSWGHEQVLGAPNTGSYGDKSTAWAPKARNGGTEWLEVSFDDSVPLAEINVHETYNPGAISQVAVKMPDGSEKVIWEGEFKSDSGGSSIVERAFQIDEDITADSVRIYMDTTRVSGWNEIDAVELVGADDSRQWASSAKASSTYAR